jgi:hypothetical protein
MGEKRLVIEDYLIEKSFEFAQIDMQLKASLFYLLHVTSILPSQYALRIQKRCRLNLVGPGWEDILLTKIVVTEAFLIKSLINVFLHCSSKG